MRSALAAALALSLLAGCATTRPGANRLAERDPLEGFNRGVWAVNRGVDAVLLKPVSTVYRTVTPKPARRGLSRVFANLTEPWSFINNLLQGKPDRAVRNLGRFLVNTTLGVGGLADHATGMGIKPAPEDFGQTLASWGVNGGPYLVLPILGPSTLRDGVGSGVGFFADPFRIAQNEANLSNTEQMAITGTQIIVARADLTDAGADTFLDSSLDPYATARSAFLQRRAADIIDTDVDAAPATNGPSDDFRIELEDTGADAGVTPAPAEAAPAPADSDAGAVQPAAPEAQAPVAPPALNQSSQPPAPTERLP